MVPMPKCTDATTCLPSSHPYAWRRAPGVVRWQRSLCRGQDCVTAGLQEWWDPSLLLGHYHWSDSTRRALQRTEMLLSPIEGEATCSLLDLSGENPVPVPSDPSWDPALVPADCLQGSQEQQGMAPPHAVEPGYRPPLGRSPVQQLAAKASNKLSPLCMEVRNGDAALEQASYAGKASAASCFHPLCLVVAHSF